MTLEEWFKAAQTNNCDYLRANCDEFAREINKQGNTALILAAMLDNVEAATVLAPLEAGVRNLRSETALFVAIKRKNLPLVRILASLEYALESHSVLPIFHTLNCNFPEAAALIAPFCRARDNYINRFGQTPYTRAIDEKNLAFIQVLGKQFGDVQDDYTMHPMTRALGGGDLGVIQAVYGHVQFNPLRSLLIEAYEAGIVQHSNVLFDKYTKMVNSRQQTALIAVCSQTRKNAFTQQEMEHLDVLSRSEACMLDEHGMSALMYAVQTRKQQVVEMLVAREARLQDLHGHTALMKAVISENAEAMRLLLKAERSIVDYCGNTALKMAVELNNIDAVEILQSEIVGDTQQNNALQRAVVKGNGRAVQAMKDGLRTQSVEQKSSYFEMTSKLDLMQSLRDVIRSGADYAQVKQRVLERHCGWDDM